MVLRYRRYRAFVVFAVIAVLALYHFGSRSPPVDYLKQQLSLRNHKADYSTAQKQEVLKDGTAPAVVPKPKVGDGEGKKGGKIEVVGDDASGEAKLVPPPVEVEKPVQDAPPSGKGEEEKVKGDTKGVKGSTGSQSQSPAQKVEEGERIRVMPDPIPADAWQKVKPLLDQAEGRWDSEQSPLYVEPVFWEKPEEHNPLSDKDVISLPTGTPKKLPKIQAKFEKETVDQTKDRLAKQGIIKEAFLHAWGGYKAKAWGHDEVKPVSGNWKDPFNGWGATLVDSLDLIWMMGLTDEFEEAVAEVAKINFQTSPRPDIPLFETTIRYLGGLLGAYDVSGGKYKVLLDKAAELSEVLIGAFDTPNRMPATFYQWRPSATAKSHRSSGRVVLAELGSLALEFTRLAQLTKEPRYYDAIARITDALDAWQDETRLPGLWPATLDATGCEKRVITGASITQVTSGNLNLMDSQGKPLSKPDFVSTGFGGASNGKGMTGKGAGTTTSNRDEDELEGVEVKHPLNPKEREKTGTETDDDVQTKWEESEDGVKVGRIAGWDEIHKEDVSTPKLPPPKKQGAEGEEFIPLQRPEPIAFKVDEGKKAKRQLRDIEATEELDPAKDPNGGVSAFAVHPDADAESIPYTPDSKASANTIPVGIPTHKHDNDVAAIPYVDPIPEAECIPHGLQSQATWGTDMFTLGSQADSTYEYLPKMYLMLNGLAPQYRRMYEKAIDVAKEHLLFRVMIPDEKREVLVSGEYTVTHNLGADPTGKPIERSSLRTAGSHLTCFVGGMFALGGKLFERPDDLQIAQKLTDGCVWAYEMTASGVMPETFHAVACEDRRECAWNESHWWAQLDPDLGAWRTKSYESSMLYYEQQMEYREKEIEEIRRLHGKEVDVESEDEELEAEESPKPDPALLRSHSDMQKRQLKVTNEDDEEPGKSKVKAAGDEEEEEEHDEEYYIKAAHAQDQYEEQQIAKQLEISKATPTTYEPETAWRQPTLTEEDLPPIYSPEKPPSHEQFVKTMIKEDRLPEGIQSMSDRRYILRPEALESVFYMHRITGSPYWRHAGWNMISSILKHTRTEFAHSAIDDVTKKHPKHLDSMESFWLAETLKYAWLLFEDEDKWSLDEWVYNTEAHPMRRLPGEGVPDGGVASKAKAAEEVEKKTKKGKSERLDTAKSVEDVREEMKKWDT